MDFENLNHLNARFNLFSGNLFPMTNGKSFSFFWKIHSAFSWLTQIILIIVMIPGYIYLPIEKLFEDEMSGFGEIFDAIMFLIQCYYISLRIHTHKDMLYQLIQNVNEMLHITDGIMKNIMPSILNPVKTPLNFYWSTNLAATSLWGSLAFLLLFEKDQFRYEDYGIPVAFTKQPFSRTTFFFGSVFIYISSLYMVLKKIGVDFYVVHLVLMVTAQYRYIALKYAAICQEESESNEFGKKYSQEVRQRKEKEIKTLCRHHKNVI
ncbi:hypothetical protein PUN28_011741 [Cardiocondyla obscurior]|uniref:Uncharacterized protein n=2 Tax=Cardiocondyla obscurior TaxID=286306 RepID=A0AAW2FL26_9HYME